MKKLLLSISFFTLALSAVAQVTITTETGTTDLSATVQTLNVQDGIGTNPTYEIYFHVNNTSGAAFTNIRYARRLLNPLPFQNANSMWDDLVCFNAPGGGSCDDVSGTYFEKIEGLQIAAGSYATLKPQMIVKGELEGNATVRYYVLEDNTMLDSIDVNYYTGTLSVKEPKVETTISVFPNPVSNMLTVATTGIDGSFTIRMTDVLGKVIYDESAAGTKKIDVSDFRNGVYIIAVLDGKQTIQSRRIVVKH